MRTSPIISSTARLLHATSPLIMSAAATIVASKPGFVVAVDGVAAPSALSSKDFLLERPAGAYTTARTCDGTKRLFEWETHVARTAASAAAMLATSGGDGDGACSAALLAALTQPEQLRPRLEATVSVLSTRVEP